MQDLKRWALVVGNDDYEVLSADEVVEQDDHEYRTLWFASRQEAEEEATRLEKEDEEHRGVTIE